MIEIAFRRLPLPCPVNRLYRSFGIKCKNGHMVHRMILSAEARKKKAALVAEMLKQLGGRGPRLDRPCQVTGTITPRDRRLPDCDAYNKQLFDCLQAAGIVTDDKLIVHHSIERLPVPHVPGWIDVTVMEIP